jgi:hypothetical protein
MTAALALVLHELRRCFAPGRWIPVLLFCALPAIVLAVMPLFGTETTPQRFFYVSTVFFFRLTPLAAALLYGMQTSASELNEPMSTFVFTSVLRRPVIFLIKWATLTLVISTHVAAGSTAAHILFSTDAASNLAWFAGLSALAAAIWTAYFMAIGFWVRWPLAVSLGFCLAMEFILGELPFDISAWSIYQSLRALAREVIEVGGSLPGAWLRKPGVNRIDFLGASTALWYLGILLSSMLALGMVALSRRPIAGRQASD